MLRQARHATGQSLAVFVRDVGQGLLEVGHNALALLGLAVVATLVFAVGRDDLRTQAEKAAYEWLQTRHGGATVAADDAQAAAEAEAEAAAKEVPPKLTRQQNAVAQWIARRYKVAPEPIGALVQEAWSVGQSAGLDPTLILAIVAVESSFNPFAQSPLGAQGLMQVMTKVHDAKYTPFGGQRAALDPISNLQVGVQVLKECIARAGGLQEGLRYYVGAALSDGDGGYVGRVLAEQNVLRRVADGKSVPVNVETRPQRETAPVDRVALAD
jgi:soluble lytic murein transglycosylase-like protein